MVGRTVSHYRIEERIGAGGMGEVYRARDLNLPRDVALKFLPHGPDADGIAKKRFKREAEAASALDHPNICTIFEIDETPEGQLFIVMAYYDGESLKQRIERGALEPRTAFEIASFVAGGLGRAHRAGIVHRDIKPGNIMITTDGFVKIVDFGVAKLADATRVTRTRYAVGTLAYMSPQQATGSDIDHRADVWALGVMFYEMLTGSLPFKGDVYEALLYAIVNQDPEPPRVVDPRIPEPVSAIVMKCLEKKVDDRFASVEDLLGAMSDTARDLGWGSSTVVPIPPAPPKLPAVWPRVVGALVVFSALIIAGYLARGQLRGLYDIFFSDKPRTFTTENRTAVLPLENLIGSAEDVMVDGLSELVSSLVDGSLRDRLSTWVVPYQRVLEAPITSPTDAVAAFGINRLVIGNVQRFGRDYRIDMRLVKASDLSEIRTVSVDFDPRTGAGAGEGLGDGINALCGDPVSAADSLLLREPPAALLDYVRALGWLQRASPAALDSARVYGLDAMAAGGRLLGGLAIGRADQTRYEIDRNKEWLRSALQHYAPVISILQSDPEVRVLAAHASYDLDDYDAAIVHCQAALDIAPGHPAACHRLALAYKRQDRYDEAEAALLAAVQHNPDYWRARFELGVFHYYNDQLDEAIGAWTKGLEFAPNDPTTLNNIGAVYWSRDDWTTARTYFDRAFRISPTCDTCSNVALLLFYEQDFEQSAEFYEFAIEYCDTTDYIVWGNLAAAQYWAEERREEAVATYRIAIRHAERELRADAENPKIVSALISYYSMSGDAENATRMIEYGLRVAGESSEVLFSIGHAYEKAKERQRALRYIGEAMRHGYALSEIETTPMLRELIEDPRFRQMAVRELSTDGSEDGESSP